MKELQQQQPKLRTTWSELYDMYTQKMYMYFNKYN